MGAIEILNQRMIDDMQKSCRIAADTLVMVGSKIQADMSTDEINTLVHDFIVTRGGRPSPLNYRGFPKSVCTSINEVVCHGIPGSHVLRDGDIINVDNYSLLQYGNLFGQFEYDFKPWKSFLAFTISTTYYQREDPYNYPLSPLSEKVNRVGFDIKAGASREIGSHGKLYANVGYYSREPYFKFVYVNFSNAVARDLRNEKITASELGYEYNSGRISGRINAYNTIWKDKAILSKKLRIVNYNFAAFSLIPGPIVDERVTLLK